MPARNAGRAQTVNGVKIQLREKVHTLDDLRSEVTQGVGGKPGGKIDKSSNPFYAKLLESYEGEYSCGARDVAPTDIDTVVRLINTAAEWINSEIAADAAELGKPHPGMRRRIRFRWSEHGEAFTLPYHYETPDGEQIIERREGRKRTYIWPDGRPYTGTARKVNDLPDKPVYIEFWGEDRPAPKNGQNGEREDTE
jgi:hypothetical protein